MSRASDISEIITDRSHLLTLEQVQAATARLTPTEMNDRERVLALMTALGIVPGYSVSGQKAAAPRLRALAIEQLKNYETPVGKSFKDDWKALWIPWCYDANITLAKMGITASDLQTLRIDPDDGQYEMDLHNVAPAAAGRSVRSEKQILDHTFNYWLNAQAQKHAWGTDVEFRALAGAFDIAYAVEGQEGMTRDTSKLGYICLENEGNAHWSVGPDLTNDDGNCLYNAIFQRLSEYVLPVLSPEQQKHVIDEINEVHVLGNISEESIRLEFASKFALEKLQPLRKEIENLNIQAGIWKQILGEGSAEAMRKKAVEMAEKAEDELAKCPRDISKLEAARDAALCRQLEADAQKDWDRSIAEKEIAQVITDELNKIQFLELSLSIGEGADSNLSRAFEPLPYMGALKEIKQSVDEKHARASKEFNDSDLWLNELCMCKLQGFRQPDGKLPAVIKELVAESKREYLADAQKLMDEIQTVKTRIDRDVSKFELPENRPQATASRASRPAWTLLYSSRSPSPVEAAVSRPSGPESLESLNPEAAMMPKSLGMRG